MTRHARPGPQAFHRPIGTFSSPARWNRPFLCRRPTGGLTFSRPIPRFLVLITAVMLVAAEAFTAPPLERRLQEEERRLAREVTQPCKTDVQRKAREGRQTISDCPCPNAERERMEAELKAAVERNSTQCEIRGIDRLLAFIEKERGAHVSRLQSLKAKFEGRVGSYLASAQEITKEYDETLERINQLFFGALQQAFIAKRAADLEGEIDQLITRFQTVRDVRRVRKEELKSYIVSLRAELKDRTPENAKRLLLRRLKEEKQAIRDFEKVGKEIGTQLLNVGASSPDRELELAYGALINSLDIAVGHGSRAVATVGKAAGILGLLPDMVDGATRLWTITVQRTELEALDQLHAVATGDFGRTKEELKILVEKRRDLQGKKDGLK